MNRKDDFEVAEKLTASRLETALAGNIRQETALARSRSKDSGTSGYEERSQAMKLQAKSMHRDYVRAFEEFMVKRERRRTKIKKGHLAESLDQDDGDQMGPGVL